MSAGRMRGLELLARVAADLSDHEAQRLLMAAAGWTRSELLSGKRPDPEQADRFAVMVERRRSGEPLQYIEGTCDFGPLTLRCDGRALIPRPETEQLWEHVVARSPAPDVAVDLGTGTGCLALACKHVWPAATVYGVDISVEALALAAENVALTGLDVVLVQGDLFAALPQLLRGSIDVVVSNPPYVAFAERAALPAEVRNHEPSDALIGGERGTEVLARIAADAAMWLRPGGLIACEIGDRQGEEAAELFAPFAAEVVADLAGKDRFVIGRRPIDDGGGAGGSVIAIAD